MKSLNIAAIVVVISLGFFYVNFKYVLKEGNEKTSSFVARTIENPRYAVRHFSNYIYISKGRKHR